MARKRSAQRGRIVPKGERLTLRYCVRDPDKQTGWRDCREVLPVGTTPQEAEAIRSKRMDVINKMNNSLLIQPAMTLELFAKTLWVEYQKERKMEESTIYSYDSMLRNLVFPSFGNLRLDRITPHHLTRLMKAAREKPYSSKYRLNLYSMLKKMFKVAMAYDLITTSPVRAEIHQPVHERKEKRSFTPEQLRALTQHVPPENRLIIETAGVLGLRSGEVLALQWGDIFGELEVEGMLYRLMYLRRSIWRGQVKPRLKTKKSRSAMPLHPALFDRLNRHKEASAWTGDQDFIFCRADGRALDPDSFRRQVFHPAMDAAGIERVPREDGLHALRHSAGTILYLMTRDLEKVKTFLRHTRIGTTSDIYVHPGLMLSAEGVEAMASVYFDVEEVGGVQ